MSEAVSHSRMQTHEGCGLKYKLAYRDRIQVEKRPPGPALERGLRLHDSAERYMLREIEQLDPELAFYGQWLHGLRENYNCQPEQAWGITKEWEPCDFDDDKAYLRGLWDLRLDPEDTAKFLEVFEYKTGKVYDKEHEAQRYLYGMAALIHFPSYESVKVSTVYFDQHKTVHDIYTRANLSSMKAHFTSKIMLMGMEATWIPNPSWKCRFCEFSKKHSGVCDFG